MRSFCGGVSSPLVTLMRTAQERVRQRSSHERTVVSEFGWCVAGGTAER